MMKTELTIIHPQDASTEFLISVSEFLGEHLRHHLRLGFDEQEHRDCLELVRLLPPKSIVIFLGHGESRGLYGAHDDEFFPRTTFVNRATLQTHFSDKIAFFLACRSHDFLAPSGIKGIGFGNLITSMADVNLQRNMVDRDAYAGITESDCDRFNQFLVANVKHSLSDYVQENLDLRELDLRLRLRFNKQIANCAVENAAQNRMLANLLLEAKNEMKCFA